MSNYPIPGIYRHYKNRLYQVLGSGHDSNIEDREVVVYIGLELDDSHFGGRWAVRTLSDFSAMVHPEDGCECVPCDQHGTYDPGGKFCEGVIPRFTYLGQVYEPGMRLG